MNVLHVINTLDARAGGPTTSLIGLASAQARAGLAVKVITTWRGQPPTEAETAMRSAGVELIAIGPTKTPLMLHPDIGPQLAKAIATADVVHTHGLWEQVQHAAAVAARAAGKPYVVEPCGMLSKWSLGQSRLRKQIFLALRLRRDLRAAAAIHFSTEMERRDSATVPLPPRTIVEPIGLPLGEFASLPPRGWLRAKYPQLAGKRVVAFLGRIHPGKGLEHLMDALPALDIANVAVAAIGPDSDGFRAILEAKLASLGLADRVVFTGMLSGGDKVAALVDCDLFALPSDHENFGLAIIEAMAAGLPAVVSDHVGIADRLAACSGVAVTTISPRAIAGALRGWCEDRAASLAAGEAARDFALREFDWSTIAGRWIEHYANLVARR